MRPLIAVLLIAASTSAAAFFSLPKTVTARVIDEATGKPLAPVYAVASEEYRAPALGHGSVTACVRSGAGVGSTPEGAHVPLPMASRKGFTGLSGGGISVSAYTPGYCIQPRSREDGDVREFRAYRNTDPPEHRIRYIAQEIFRLKDYGCHDGEVAPGSSEALQAMVSGAIEEAKGIARTQYEKYLAERLTLALSGRNGDEARFPIGRSFVVVDASRPKVAVNWDTWNTTCRGCSRIEAPSVRPPGEAAPAAPPPRYVVICRGENECDFERRNPSGATYLYELIEDGDAARVKALLEAGADPNAERYPGGPTGLSSLLSNAFDSSAGAERAIETVRVLVADGRAMVGVGSANGLRRKADVTDARHATALRAIADLVDKSPPRREFTPVCPLEKRSLPFQFVSPR